MASKQFAMGPRKFLDVPTFLLCPPPVSLQRQWLHWLWTHKQDLTARNNRANIGCHGRRSRGDGVQVPRNLEWGDANANCPPDFVWNVLWPSKYAKIRFRPVLCPGPRWGNSRRNSNQTPYTARKRTPSSYPIPLGTHPSSAEIGTRPQNFSQI